MYRDRVGHKYLKLNVLCKVSYLTAVCKEGQRGRLSLYFYTELILQSIA